MHSRSGTWAAMLLVAACSATPSPATAPRPMATAPTDDSLSPGTHRATLNGAELVYHVVGSGPPLVVLSGGPGGSWAYLRMPPAIAEHATLIHLELLGTGASARLDDPAQYSLARDAADVDALREHLGLQTVGLLGHSYGGFVALQVTLEHPGTVDRLVLYDTTATNGPEFTDDLSANVAARADRPWFADATASFAAAEAAQTDAELDAALRGAMPLYFHDWPSAAATDEFLATLKFAVDRSSRGTKTAFDYRPRLHEIAIPTLVIVGATDFVCSPKMAAYLHEGIPGARLVTLDESGHFGHVEQPEAFASAVIDLLAGRRDTDPVPPA